MASSTIKRFMRTKTLTQEVSINGGERISKGFTAPTGTNKIIAATMVESPNKDWVICRPYIINGSSVWVYMHNEYTGTLSGSLSVLIIYE